MQTYKKLTQLTKLKLNIKFLYIQGISKILNNPLNCRNKAYWKKQIDLNKKSINCKAKTNKFKEKWTDKLVLLTINIRVYRKVNKLLEIS